MKQEADAEGGGGRGGWKDNGWASGVQWCGPLYSKHSRGAFLHLSLCLCLVFAFNSSLTHLAQRDAGTNKLGNVSLYEQRCTHVELCAVAMCLSICCCRWALEAEVCYPQWMNVFLLCALAWAGALLYVQYDCVGVFSRQETQKSV